MKNQKKQEVRTQFILSIFSIVFLITFIGLAVSRMNQVSVSPVKNELSHSQPLTQKQSEDLLITSMIPIFLTGIMLRFYRNHED